MNTYMKRAQIKARASLHGLKCCLLREYFDSIFRILAQLIKIQTKPVQNRANISAFMWQQMLNI